MNRFIGSWVAALALISLALASQDAPPSPRTTQIDTRDSVSWDTSAWGRLQDAQPVATTALSTEPLLIGFLAEVPGSVGRFRTAIRNLPMWDSVWMQITSNGRFGGACCRATPSVDFDRQMILAAGNGVHQDGDDVAIVRAATRRDTLYVYVLSSSYMLPGCLLYALVNPVSIVRTVRWQGPVVFAEGIEHGSCAKSSKLRACQLR